MARYIDAEKLEEALRADYDREGKKSYTYAAYGDDDLAVKYSHGQFCYLNAMERVKDAPTADVAPRAEVAREIFEEIERLRKYNTDVAFKHYNDGIKEFAERLKVKVGSIPQYHFNLLQVEDDIDTLVKEMTEELK